MSIPDDFDVQSLDRQANVLLGRSLPRVQTNTPILVRHLTALYRQHTKEKYRNTPTEKTRYDQICDMLDNFAGDEQAEMFGPVRLKTFREILVTKKPAKGKRPLARKYVNRLTNCVVAIFKNAVAGELIELQVVERLRTLEPLRRGQTDAPERDEIEPAVIEHVRATAKHLTPIVKAMLRGQITTGMRPKEIIMMRPCDIDCSGEVWVYRPSDHKTAWVGRKKAVPIVGDARQAITDYLEREPDAYLFSPAESMAWRRAVGAANRTTPLSCGNRAGSNRKKNPKRTPKTQYTTSSYHQAAVQNFG